MASDEWVQVTGAGRDGDDGGASTSDVIVRFVCYGLLGWGVEIVWTALGAALFGQSAPGSVAVPTGRARWALAGRTYIWMFPIYGAMVFLYEPLHQALRPWAWPLRALVYAAAFMAVEYAAGWVLRRTTGACPWDYAARRNPSRWQVHGLIRLDYAPAWATLGLALEPVHDFLVRVTPALVRAL